MMASGFRSCIPWVSAILMLALTSELHDSEEQHIALVQVEIQQSGATPMEGDVDYIPGMHFTATYAAIGSQTSASGNLITIHPLGLCNSYTNPLLPIGWIGVVHLDLVSPGRRCSSLYYKAQRAVDRGATAIIYDVTNSKGSELEMLQSSEGLRQSPPLRCPVLLVRGTAAHRLQRLLMQLRRHSRKHQRVARAVITPKMKGNVDQKASTQKAHTRALLELGIFVVFFIIFCGVCVVIVIKLRRKNRHRNSSLTSLTKEVVGKLETRLYRTPCQSAASHYSLLKATAATAATSTGTPDGPVSKMTAPRENCAICLEEFHRGDELRVMPCKHEFHKPCIDPWLMENHTCPLCMIDILECPNHEIWCHVMAARRRKLHPLRRKRPPDTSGNSPGAPVDTTTHYLSLPPPPDSLTDSDDQFDGSMAYFASRDSAADIDYSSLVDFSFGFKNPYYRSPPRSRSEDYQDQPAGTSYSSPYDSSVYQLVYMDASPADPSASDTDNLLRQPVQQPLSREDSNYSIKFNLHLREQLQQQQQQQIENEEQPLLRELPPDSAEDTMREKLMVLFNEGATSETEKSLSQSNL